MTSPATGLSERADYDVLIVGGGPAGLSAALNLGRALARVLVIDADRPRNAATLRSHGFLTRDGIPPQELRRLAREELAAYPNVEVRSRTRVTAVRASGDGFAADIGRREAETTVTARAVLLATGLRETLPDVPNLRGYYGMSVFSCAACDAWELQGRNLALIGETTDLADRARLIGRWTESLTVFTHGADVVTATEEAELAAAGIAVRRHPIVELMGDRGRIEAIRLADDTTVAVDGGFVRPEWESTLSFLDGIAPTLDDAGHLRTDRSGRTDVPGLYAAGDAAAPGPQQLIVAAGAGARVAAVIVHDSIGIATAH
ncbi:MULTISPECIES: NAD(P)/FAD-dependent oxidoreductase [unclassified Microbacterium]|uniref:NAD(P)/FAD-dependent oxidoreductase n=1 Tax=unclassified Microbacterium TaxID=2609290 RepID=UPI000CFABC01|nr:MULTISPECIES: NAD(P)/FAD-dependent oxidoreductase [unclassified Microbacterium]PQZ60050.1 pyridine nucleotide-disulfide oxidoreductase [Microbacterium sp. MYb43]PQZ79602.1 pyridine nucleotide-disulfide oxidoreductase [Microbacterium sp. MYb40]PRB23093.1 pyridine nucleotide-disulfide oxidoreductase [Microbacterium sp. MYb54]PRB27628.1 pyridine nucleotide-disulfide oxidoreductase [Microbacterium sp. MYb50]PRB65951.1 pyridine nucleotide-disulfide oxidoreductase [Microbacterium sp. MYb24]